MTLATLEAAVRERMEALGPVVRIGRTCLQDAVPLTFGQSLSGYASLLERTGTQIAAFRKRSATGILGATAVGTGIGVQPGFMQRIYRNLSSITGLPVRRNPNPFDGMQNSDGAMTLSALVRNAAAACGKIARDCLLLSSGPECGIGELRLGPGFPDPDALHVCKLVIQIAHQVGANDWAIGMAAQSGEPDIAPSGGIKLIALLESLELTRNAAPLLAEACVQRFLFTYKGNKYDEQQF